MAAHSQAPVASVRDLRVYFRVAAGHVHAVDGVSFDIGPGENLGLVGESGSGKSVTALSTMRLLPSGKARCEGRILLQGQDLLQASEREMRSVRGGSIGMIFQEPMTSLNPVFTIGNQIAEALVLHRGMSW